MRNHQSLDAGQIRMREHLETITGRYIRLCQEVSITGHPVEEDERLEELLREGEFAGKQLQPTHEHFGLLLKNLSFSMQSVQQQAKDYSEHLKQCSLFEMEPSMHTGETFFSII